MTDFRMTLAAAICALGLSGGAQAVTVSCDTAQFGGSVACRGPIGTNDSEAAVAGFFDIPSWTEIVKLDRSSGTAEILTVTAQGGADKISGTWAVTGWTGWSQVMAVLKGGPSFSAYLLDLTQTSGTWTTQGLVKGNGNPGPGLSHVTLYGLAGTPPLPVPLPAAGFLLAGALGGLVLLRRRRG